MKTAFQPRRIQPACIAACSLLWLLLVASADAQARFAMILPTTNLVDETQPEVTVTLAFTRPFEHIGINLEWPEAVFVSSGGNKQDLKGSMLETSFLEKQAWKFTYTPPHPGVYWFAMEQTPYLPPGGDSFVIHHTKTALAAYGNYQGWDQPVGLKTEIIPLLRPFGNYSGNTFIGRVLLDGAPAAGSQVEVELYNQENWVQATDAHITQVVETDDNGIFIFTCPLPGWWGFSASNAADFTLKGPDGKDKKVELKATIWVYFDPNPYTGQ